MTPNAKKCISKDEVFLKQFLPTGDSIRDMCNEALTSSKNPWGVGAHDQHTREIQNVDVTRGSLHKIIRSLQARTVNKCWVQKQFGMSPPMQEK